MTDVSHAPWPSTTLLLQHSYSQFAEIAGRPSLQSVPNARIRAKCNNNGAPGLLLNAESDKERETSAELPPGGRDGHYEQIGDLEPLARQRANEDRAVSQAPNIDRGSYPTPGHVEYAQDDNLIRVQPSVYVDYLSHDWKEEDIWTSWKYVVSETKRYRNSARLQLRFQARSRSSCTSAHVYAPHYLSSAAASSLFFLNNHNIELSTSTTTPDPRRRFYDDSKRPKHLIARVWRSAELIRRL